MSQHETYVCATANYEDIISYFKVKPSQKVNGRTKGKAHVYCEAHTLADSEASPKSNIRSSCCL